MVQPFEERPNFREKPWKNCNTSGLGFEDHFFPFLFRLWVDFGSQNGGQNEEKNDKNRGRKKDEKKSVPGRARPELGAPSRGDTLLSGTPPGLPKVTKVTLFWRKEDSTN